MEIVLDFECHEGYFEDADEDALTCFACDMPVKQDEICLACGTLNTGQSSRGGKSCRKTWDRLWCYGESVAAFGDLLFTP